MERYIVVSKTEELRRVRKGCFVQIGNKRGRYNGTKSTEDDPSLGLFEEGEVYEIRNGDNRMFFSDKDGKSEFVGETRDLKGKNPIIQIRNALDHFSRRK